MAHDVFISYDFDDKSAAETILRQLEVRGIKCWIAPRSIPPGVDYAEAIVDAISAARAVLVVFGSNTSNSVGVRRELHLADNHRKTICAVIRIADVQPQQAIEYLLAGVQWIDAFAPGHVFEFELVRDRLKAMDWSPQTSPSLPTIPFNATRRSDLLAEVERLGQERYIALTGLPGTGKSTLARFVAQDAQDSGKSVYWLNADGDGQLRQSLFDLGRLLGFEGDDKKVVPETCAQLSSQADSLIILDNVISWDESASILKSLRGSARILLTTQSRSWRQHGVAMVDVRPFSEEDALAFLMQRCGQVDRDQALPLVKELGCLPLALAQAASYLETTQCSPDEYLELLHHQPVQLLDEHAPAEHTQSFAMSLELSLLRLSQASRMLLNELCLLAPGAVPISYLRDRSDPIAWDNSFAGLSAFSLAERRPGFLETHRLVRHWVRNRLGENRITAVNAVLRRLPRLLEEGAIWLDNWNRRYRRTELAHLAAALELAEGAEASLVGQSLLAVLPLSRPYEVDHDLDETQLRRLAALALRHADLTDPPNHLLRLRAGYLLATFLSLDTDRIEIAARCRELLQDLRASGVLRLDLEIHLLCDIAVCARDEARIREALEKAVHVDSLFEHAQSKACLMLGLDLEVEGEENPRGAYHLAKIFLAEFQFAGYYAVQLRRFASMAAWDSQDKGAALVYAAEYLAMVWEPEFDEMPGKTPTSTLECSGMLTFASLTPNKIRFSPQQRQRLELAKRKLEAISGKDKPLVKMCDAILSRYQLKLVPPSAK